MKTIKLKGADLKIYQDIDELPIVNYWKAKEYWQLENGIPTTPEGVLGMYREISELNQKGMQDNVRSKINSLIMSHIKMTEGIDHTSLCFGCFVYSYGGKIYNGKLDNSELKELLEKLSKSGLTYSLVKQEVDSLKKKFTSSLK